MEYMEYMEYKEYKEYMDIYIYIYIILYIYIWLVVLTCFNHLEKYEFVNGKDDIPYMKWNIKFMFETTNQIYTVYRSTKWNIWNIWIHYMAL